MSMETTDDVLSWLREAYATYTVEPVAVFRKRGDHDWPLVASDAADLHDKLSSGGHLLPLPKEPAALANIIEVSLVDFLFERMASRNDITLERGTERGYPDIEISGPGVGDRFYALDVKVARRAKSGNQTQSRITLYTGNTYFMYPQLKWPGTFRPFQDYAAHLDLIALYDLNTESDGRIDNFELVVQETWRIGSKQRSSTTREYIGAVMSIEDLRSGKGEFDSEDAFYAFWRKYPFKIGKAVQQQLKKLLEGR